MKRRVLSVFLALCMIVSVTSALSVTASAAATTFTINGVTVSTASGTSVKNCSSYASEVLKKIWNNYNNTSVVTTTFNSKYNMLKGKSAADRKITESHVKSYIQNAPLGSRIRVCSASDTTTNNYDNSRYGHTMVLVAKDNNAGTFTVLHAGWGAAEAKTYTYKNFANYYANTKGYQYFFYIADLSSFATKTTTTTSTNSSTTPTTPVPALKINLTTKPTSITQGNSFGLYGTVTSGSKITKVQGSVINASGKTVLTSTDTPNSTSMDINKANLNKKLTFNTLAAGKYTLKIVATDASGKSATVTQSFTVVKSNLKINLTSYPTSIKKGSSYGLRGTVSSNAKITKVQGYVINASGKTILSSTDTPSSTSLNIRYANLNNKLTFNTLAVGTYTMKVVATDASGNSVTWSKTFKVTK